MVLSADYGHTGVVGAHGDTDVLFPQAEFWPVELINSVCVCVSVCLANGGWQDWSASY